MSSADLIASSFKAAWQAGGGAALVLPNSIYYGRAKQPDKQAGFPFIELLIAQTSNELRSQQSYDSDTALVSYTLTVEVWTCQGMSTSSGDQLTDQGNIQRAVDAVMTKIIPGQAWYNVTTFIHAIKDQQTAMAPDSELYQGQDVTSSIQSYLILLGE